MKQALVALLATAGLAAADDEVRPQLGLDALDVRLHLEVDPLPFALGGYGVQPGVRIGQLRAAIGNFSLDVPESLGELGGNDRFHLRVRPGSTALYVLYFLSTKRNSIAVGGALRFLRMQYSHDDETAKLKTAELSPEAIVGYKYHPTKYGFYLIPWFGLSFTAYRSDDLVVGTHEYEPLPVQAFFTVNIGWELVL